MAIADCPESNRGQMSLPPMVCKRWQMDDGGTVEVADLGHFLLIAPGSHGGLRSVVRAAIEDAGGHANPAAKIASAEPGLA